MTGQPMRSFAIKRRSAGPSHSVRLQKNADILKSVGIEKGKPFNPDPKTQDILKTAACDPGHSGKVTLSNLLVNLLPRILTGRSWLHLPRKQHQQ
jgi:hypothetical protein